MDRKVRNAIVRVRLQSSLWGHELNDAQNFNLEVESAFAKEAKRLWNSAVDQEDLESLTEQHNEAGQIFPLLHRKTMIVSLMSILETSLIDYCEALGKVKPENKLTHNDIKSRGGALERLLKFLDKVVGLTIDKNRIEWKEVTQLRSVRNHIVHQWETSADANADVWNKAREYAKSRNGLRVEKHGRRNNLILTEDFLPEALEIIRSFLNLVADEANELVRGVTQ